MKKLLLMLLITACVHAPKVEVSKVSAVTGFEIFPHELQILDNGLKIIWIPDAKLPVVTISMMVRAGSSLDPKGKEGLASVTANLLDQGVPHRSALQIAEQLEQRADSFAANLDSDATFIGIRGLSFHDFDSLNDFYELATQSTFPLKELEREKKNMVVQLSRIFDRPAELASLAFEKYILGDHPYAHGIIGTAENISSISREDILGFYKKYYSPDRSTLAVVGQFDNDYKNKLIELFSKWKKGPAVEEAALPAPGRTSGLQILEIQKPGLAQTEIRVGDVGVKRNIPDHLPLKVANTILGQSAFLSRLMTEIRIKRGLTYGIHSIFDQRIEAGPFEISTFTRNDKIVETVTGILNVVRTFRDKGVSDEEVETAKASLIGKFSRLLETGDDVARQMLILDLYGIDFDYLKNFQDNVRKITTAEVNAAVALHFNPENFKVVVFSPPTAKGLEALKDVGPVTVQDFHQAL